MFPEYRDLISRLKNENPRFMSLFDKHNKLDHEIARKEGSDGRGYNAEVVRMKKQKLQLKMRCSKSCSRRASKRCKLS
ncbi:protein [Escherichia coli]|uniref:Protein n=1 Tax=Escherichia coli TaxID=562 RepID=A0A2X1MX59_ECOLX|nr:protein [Escherichia coli]